MAKKNILSKLAGDVTNPPKRRAIVWTIIIAAGVVYVMFNRNKIKNMLQRGWNNVKGLLGGRS